MKLYIDTGALGSAGRQVQAKVSEMSASVNHQVLSRGTRAVNQMRDAELEVLRGNRSGKTYRKSPYKSTYTASAPGEPPARRTGALRVHWSGDVKGSGGDITLCFSSDEKYSIYLDEGTRKMAARPFKDRIIEKSLPAVKSIFSEPYT